MRCQQRELASTMDSSSPWPSFFAIANPIPAVDAVTSATFPAILPLPEASPLAPAGMAEILADCMMAVRIIGALSRSSLHRGASIPLDPDGDGDPLKKKRSRQKT